MQVCNIQITECFFTCLFECCLINTLITFIWSDFDFKSNLLLSLSLDSSDLYSNSFTVTLNLSLALIMNSSTGVCLAFLTLSSSPAYSISYSLSNECLTITTLHNVKLSLSSI
jgi:hypothetical protein